MGKLIDVQSAKDFVSITSTSQDSLIDFILEKLSSAIARYLALKGFDYENVTDIYFPTYGEYKRLLVLSKYPVDLSQPFNIVIVDYQENETSISSDKYFVNSEKGYVYFQEPLYTNNMIKVTYTAGYQIDVNGVYQNVDDGLRFACLLWFATIWNTRELRGIDRIDMTTRQMIEISTQSIPDDVKQILHQYQRAYL